MSPATKPTKDEIAEYLEQMLFELIKLAKKIDNKPLVLVISAAAFLASQRFRDAYYYSLTAPFRGP